MSDEVGGDDGLRSGKRFEAATTAADTGRGVFVNRDVAELARAAAAGTEDLAAQDEARACRSFHALGQM